MSLLQETLPALREDVAPPVIRGVADLTSFAYQGHGFGALVERIGAPADQAAHLFDLGIACQLDFHRAEGLALQQAALSLSPLYRVGGAEAQCPSPGQSPLPAAAPAAGAATLRLLAIAGAGDLMVNTPLDFLTRYLDVRLDLLHVLPDQALPATIPDHDVAFFANSDPDPAMLRRLAALYDAWPRPVLNDPRHLPATARDTLARALAGIDTIRAPEVAAVDRATLAACLTAGAPLPGFVPAERMYPCLIRPSGSHAGHGLARIASAADLHAYLLGSTADRFYVTVFEAYAGADGLYRKSRIAFVDRRPYLCHMAVSSHWMVHYLNAGMDDSAAKRAAEAEAMATFDDGFARRHAAAFAALHERLGFDLYSIDCAETRDGRLLVFEADAAAIIHLMDPATLYPYKQRQMRRVFDAFGALLRRRAAAG